MSRGRDTRALASWDGDSVTATHAALHSTLVVMHLALTGELENKIINAYIYYYYTQSTEVVDWQLNHESNCQGEDGLSSFGLAQVAKPACQKAVEFE